MDMPEDYPMAEIQHEKRGDTDVRRQEVADGQL